MKISYAITVCNEREEIERLLSFLISHIRKEDEIVVLVDLTKNEATSDLLGYLHRLRTNNKIQLLEDRFNNDFAEWKNRLSSICSGDYIFQIDADEMVDEYVINVLPQVLEHNDVDVIMVPRINTVEGLTLEHVSKWGWRVDENGWVNWPDYQWRIYKNSDDIKWVNKVHEKLDGYKTLSHLPRNPEWCLLHPKTIERQEKQNEFYDTL
jgi:GT2 family glycosyltransferase